MDLIEQENPVAVDWVNSMGGKGKKFKWYYSTEDYKNLSGLNDACNTWFDAASPDVKAAIITTIEGDARGAALPNVLNSFESNSTEADITRYMEYFTGSYTFFVNPTYKTRQYFLTSKISQSEESNIKKVLTAESKDNNFVACFTFAPFLGAIGFEGFSKDTYERLANVISTKNRRELLGQ
ncbi:hypothetical protein [Alteromonas stellipolaris]